MSSEELKKLVRQLKNAAYSQGVADERDSWTEQDKYAAQVRVLIASLNEGIDSMSADQPARALGQ